jgi:nicotinamidase-related amidase
MDRQNDIVHENGKLAAATKGAMPRMVKEKNVLGTIAGLAAAGVPIVHVRHAYRPDYAELPQNAPLLRGAEKAASLKDGTWDAEIHPHVAPLSQDILITKTRVSVFFASPLEAILTSQGITILC